MSIDIATRGTSLHVTDSVEQRQCVLRMPEPAAAEPIDGERFYFPVDATARIDTESITLGSYVATFIRNGDGDVVAQMDRADGVDLDPGEYLIELEQPVKLYVRIEGSLHVETSGMTTTIGTDGDLFVAGRSRHNHPAGTITTTGEPREMMRAVSAMSSSLKTTSVERSYPTLRGHPPEIELGDELEIPDGMTAADAGVRIEAPPRLRFVYPVAPLAFYLGAEIVPGPVPRLVGEDGFSYRLDGANGFEQTVGETLKQTVLFDCVARTEGFYEIDLAEREDVDALVDLDWADLYGRSLSEQLDAYLSIPYERIADCVPKWKTAGYVAPDPENAELLPYLLDDLATIRTPAGEATTAEQVQTDSLFDFARAGSAPSADTLAGPTRSTARSTEMERAQKPEGPLPDLVDPEPTGAFETVWADDGVPVGATKASVDGYRNGLEHTPSEEIGVTVVVNDEGMDEEGTVAEEVYGDDTEFPFDLRVYRNLTTDRLKAVLETDREFLHYVGHIEHDGFECTDGRLDARELDSVGVDAFFLNGCASYDQGIALLENGAVGGVVTLTEVVNSGATRVGEAMVKLLNHGFPIHSAINVASEQSFVGGQYSVVGDGDVDVVQGESIGASITDIEQDGDEYVARVRVYPDSDLSTGGMASMALGDDNRHHLAPGILGEVRYKDLESLLDDSEEDLGRYEGELTWLSDLA
ncbi:hypothetical protein B4589_014350 [Halolamina sp. CBA1230]|uniref:hypothetical protein n=1 Tax=Halolamina sp. CBA1230 TaxID=1853690 RepID=UPI0009A19FE2|nr:hypothetical protein [Halolamina sp. CBA1230]QKY21493.1 hypothetical protein B4589_014350 [Halolamina sp. CBA1230]